jgi:hypothetical protein
MARDLDPTSARILVAELLERLAASYPVPRLGTTLEVADLICFAASEAPATSPVRRSTSTAI